MAAIVFKSGSQPWRQGGRTTETFRSGLIKVTDTYITPIAVIDAGLLLFPVGNAISDVSQALDGVKIYPEPQWKDNGDGFATISVTGYGRTRAATGFTVEPRLTAGDLIVKEYVNEVFTLEKLEPITKTDFICRYVLEGSEKSLFNEFSTLENSFQAYDSNGSQVDHDTLKRTVALSESNYFGSFTEVVAAVIFQPTRNDYSTT